jgi:hypothetical protein
MEFVSMKKQVILLTFLITFGPGKAACADGQSAQTPDTQFVDLCQKLLATETKESESELQTKLADSAAAKRLFEATVANERLSRDHILLIKQALSNLPLADQMEIIRVYMTLSLREFGFIPAPDYVAKCLTVLYFSNKSIEDIFVSRFDNETTEEVIAMVGINRLRHSGIQFDLEKGHFEASPQVLEDYERNVSAFLNKSDFVREDWKFGQAMAYPKTGGWRFWQKALSEFAKLKILNRDGKAFFAMKVWNPDTQKFEMHDYPVVRLSEKGNPILLIHPRSHILVPTQPVVEKMEKYERRETSLTKVTASRPVPLEIYYGYKHLGMFEQLIARTDGPHRIYSAWKRREPIYVEITDGSDYYPFSVIWKTLRTRFN